MPDCSPHKTGSAKLPPAAAASTLRAQGVQDRALGLGLTRVRVHRGLRPEPASQALWINFPSQLHPSPGDGLSLPSSPNDSGLPPTPETLIFLLAAAAPQAAGCGSFHVAPRWRGSGCPPLPRLQPHVHHHHTGGRYLPSGLPALVLPVFSSLPDSMSKLKCSRVWGERQGQQGLGGGAQLHAQHLLLPSRAIVACSISSFVFGVFGVFGLALTAVSSSLVDGEESGLSDRVHDDINHGRFMSVCLLLFQRASDGTLIEQTTVRPS